MGETTMDVQLFKLTGLHCEACTKLTAKRIKALPGVADASVDLPTGKAEVITSRRLTADDINLALEGSEYHAEEYHE